MDKVKFKLEALKAIDDIFEKVEKLEQKRDNLSASLKASYDKQIVDLNRRKAELKTKLENFQETSDEKREEAKKAISESMKHYKAGFAELRKIFK